MVSSISGSMMPPPPPQSSSGSQSSLSDEQLLTIEEVLAEYDVDNLTSEDALSIVETFKEAGVAPGQALEEAMSSAGFDAQEVGKLAGVGGEQGGGPPPPPESSDSAVTLNISDQMLQDLNELLDSYYEEDISDEDKETTLASISRSPNISAEIQKHFKPIDEQIRNSDRGSNKPDDTIEKTCGIPKDAYIRNTVEFLETTTLRNFVSNSCRASKESSSFVAPTR